MDGWVEQMDPHTNEYYYYNVDTGEQQWDIPEALGGEELKSAIVPRCEISFDWTTKTRKISQILESVDTIHKKL